MRLLKLTIAVLVVSLFAGCVTVRQQDLDAWVASRTSRLKFSTSDMG